MFIDDLKAVIGLPVHALWFRRERVFDAVRAAQAFPDLSGAGELPVQRTFGLGLVAKPVAFAAVERSSAIEDTAAPMASGAEEPLTASTKIGASPIEKDCLLDIPPFLIAMVPPSIVEQQVTIMDPVGDVS